MSYFKSHGGSSGAPSALAATARNASGSTSSPLEKTQHPAQDTHDDTELQAQLPTLSNDILLRRTAASNPFQTDIPRLPPDSLHDTRPPTARNASGSTSSPLEKIIASLRVELVWQLAERFGVEWKLRETLSSWSHGSKSTHTGTTPLPSSTNTATQTHHSLEELMPTPASALALQPPQATPTLKTNPRLAPFSIPSAFATTSPVGSFGDPWAHLEIRGLSGDPWAHLEMKVGCCSLGRRLPRRPRTSAGSRAGQESLSSTICSTRLLAAGTPFMMCLTSPSLGLPTQ